MIKDLLVRVKDELEEEKSKREESHSNIIQLLD